MYIFYNVYSSNWILAQTLIDASSRGISIGSSLKTDSNALIALSAPVIDKVADGEKVIAALQTNKQDEQK